MVNVPDIPENHPNYYHDITLDDYITKLTRLRDSLEYHGDTLVVTPAIGADSETTGDFDEALLPATITLTRVVKPGTGPSTVWMTSEEFTDYAASPDTNYDPTTDAVETRTLVVIPNNPPNPRH